MAKSTITVSNQPVLNTNAYASITINGVIKGASLNIYNLDTDQVIVEKVEVYEKGKLITTYKKTDLEANEIPTEILPGSLGE